MPQQEVGSRYDKLLSDQKVYITRRILIVRRISYKQYSKSYIALFLSNTHLRRFYCKWVAWEVLSKGELLPHEVILRGYYEVTLYLHKVEG